jgi:hypothetical protein
MWSPGFDFQAGPDLQSLHWEDQTGTMRDKRRAAALVQLLATGWSMLMAETPQPGPMPLAADTLLLLSRRVPASLRLPHTSVIRQQPADVTT